MAKSIYGFAQSSTGTGSGSTTAIRLYTRAIQQGASASGVVNDPAVIRAARQTYLEPLADNLQVSTKIAESINDERQLQDKLDNVGLASSTFKTAVDDTLHKYAEAYYNSPSQLVQMNAFVLNTAVDQLGNEIDQRKADGQTVGDLQNLMNDLSTRAASNTRLARQVMATGKPQNPNMYGWFVKTNPDDGSLVSISVDSADSLDKQSGYRRTDTMYGGIPLWVNTVYNDKGQEIARVGNNQYKAADTKDNSGASLMQLDSHIFGRWFASLAPGGEKPGEVKTNAHNINLGSIPFGDVLKLPKGSVAKDAAGNYFYYGSDGVYKAANKDVLSKYLTNIGSPMANVDASAFPITREEVQNFGSFSNPDGSSRMIDEKLLSGSLHTNAPTNNLPAINQPVSGTFQNMNLPGGLRNADGTPATAPFQVPRKAPSLPATTKESINGQPSVPDMIQKEAEKQKTIFAPVVQSIKAILGR